MPVPSFRGPKKTAFREKVTRPMLRQLARAGGYAVDKGAAVAKDRMRAKMQAAGLGRLGMALRKKSSFQKDKGQARGQARSFQWGVIYIDGSEDGRSHGAIDAYSQGATIRARRRRWLAFPTDRIPKRVGRKKITPALYNASPLTTSIGPLRFVRKSNRVAFLVVENVRVHRGTGRARKGGRRSKNLRPKPFIVAFVLIRVTRRDRRFNPVAIMKAQQRLLGRYVSEALDKAGA